MERTDEASTPWCRHRYGLRCHELSSVCFRFSLLYFQVVCSRVVFYVDLHFVNGSVVILFVLMLFVFVLFIVFLEGLS